MIGGNHAHLVIGAVSEELVVGDPWVAATTIGFTASRLSQSGLGTRAILFDFRTRTGCTYAASEEAGRGYGRLAPTGFTEVSPRQ